MKLKGNKSGKNENLLSIVIVLIIALTCIVSFVRKKTMMKDSGLTTCNVVNIYNTPGLQSGLQAEVHYCVCGTKYVHRTSLPRNTHIKIGDEFRLKYSLKDPSFCTVLWTSPQSPDNNNSSLERGTSP